MATVTNDFGSLSSIETAATVINGSYSLANALIWAQAAYDNAYYFSATYSSASLTLIAGTLNNPNRDLFTAVGSNLLSYPYTITRLDYQFVQSNVAVSLYGAVSTAYSGASESGYINKFDVSSGSYGKVSVVGYDNVALYGDSTISTVTWAKDGVVLTASGQLSAYSYVGSDGYYHASVSGTYSGMTLTSAGKTLQISGLAVDANTFTGFLTANSFLENVLSGADQIAGTATSEALLGYGGADVISAGSGDDALTGGQGNDTLNGDGGNDTAIFGGVRSGYSITKTATGYIVSDTNSADGNDGVDALTNVELAQFSDQTITLAALDTTPPVAPKLITNGAFNFLIDPQITLQTSLGTVILELNPEQAPITTANMLAYVNSGFYDSTLFHRVIPGFMVQGGGLTSGLVTKTPTYSAITLESNNGLSNLRGTIAMARTSVADSATTQFFVNQVDNPFLNYSSAAAPGYAVFGKVVSGLSVIDSIAQVSTATVSPYSNVPLTDVIMTSLQQTLAGSSIANVATLTVGGLENGAQWTYSLDFGSTWMAGTGNSFVVPVGNYAASAIQVRQTDTAGNVSASAGKLTSALVVETTAPTVSHFSPADEAAGVTLNGNVVLTFSEAIVQGTGVILLKNSTGSIIETFEVANSPRVTVAGNTLTINPTSDLAYNAGYRVELASGNVKDLAGNIYSGTSSYNFTTLAPPNNLPTGSVTLTGTVTQGQTLSVTNALADIDGLGAIAYQWKADGQNLTGASGSTLLLTQAQVGKVISVSASYTDGYGNAESVMSASSAVVANINDSPSVGHYGKQSVGLGQVISLNPGMIFSDPDGDTLTFSASGLPSGLSIDPSSGLISGSTPNVAGVHHITVSGVDPANAMSHLAFDLDVIVGNQFSANVVTRSGLALPGVTANELLSTTLVGSLYRFENITIETNTLTGIKTMTADVVTMSSSPDGAVDFSFQTHSGATLQGFQLTGSVSAANGWSLVENTQVANSYGLSAIKMGGTIAADSILGKVMLTLPNLATDSSVLSLTAATLGNQTSADRDLSYSRIDLGSTGHFSTTLADSNFALSLERGTADYLVNGISKPVTAADALDALKLSVGLSASKGNTWKELISADMNHDGRVTAADALEILKVSVGINTIQPNWVFVPNEAAGLAAMTKSSVTYKDDLSFSSITAPGSANITGILVGDVNNSWVIPA